jgi:acetyl esterase/lipase
VIDRERREEHGPEFFHTHGGGMVFGIRFDGVTGLFDAMQRHDAALLTVEYRLAPEHPDPYPVADRYAGLVGTAEPADELGIDPDRIIIAGATAGGGLAAGAAPLARDRKGQAPLAQIPM